MATREQCENVVRAAEAGTVTLPLSGGGEWLAFRYADCSRFNGRFDLATKMIDLISALPGPISEEITKQIEAHREAIAAENRGFVIEDGTGNTGLEEETLANELPPIWIRGWNFATAMLRHGKNNLKMCSQEKIDRRLSICQACPKLTNNHCSLCGCACNEQNRLLNKLALESEKCPLSKW